MTSNANFRPGRPQPSAPLELVWRSPADPALHVATRYHLEFLGAALLALLLAVSLPLATTVCGLIAFGVIHNYLELRYLIGRFSGVLDRPLVGALCLLVTLIAVVRLAPLGPWAQQIEIAAGYGLLVLVLVRGFGDRAGHLLLGLGLVSVAAAVSLAQPAYHFVVISHLHNIVPVFFLWEWARSMPSGSQRVSFRALHPGWALGIPTLILVGAVDGVLAADHGWGAGLVANVGPLADGLTPPAWREGILPSRFLATFAFLQAMHYFVWCWFIPRVGRDEVAQFERTLAARGLPSGRRLTLLAATCAVAMGIVLWSDYQLGRTVYGALASYHAYLEYPILLLFILGVRRRSP